MKKSNQKFKVVAEDNNSPFLHNWLFILGISKYKLLGMDGPVMAVISRRNKIDYLAQMDTWQSAHEDLKKRVKKNHNYVEKLIDLAETHGNFMNRWTEKNIFKAPLHKYSNKRLISLFKAYAELDAKEYVYGVALPLLDFQGFALIENTVTNFLKSKVPANKFRHYFGVFTEPLHNSFSQEQEENLLRLIRPYYKNAVWRKDIQKLPLNKLARKHPVFYKKLSAHTKRFSWVYYVYKGPAYSEKDFLELIKETIAQKTNPTKKLKQFKTKKINNQKLKSRYLKQLDPDAFNKQMLLLAGKLVWAKPRRKDYQTKSYYHLEKLQAEIARRLFISLEQVRSTPINILEKFLKTGKVNVQFINSMFNLHICLRTGDGKVAILHGKAAEKFLKDRTAKILSPIPKSFHSQKELSGQTAFPGLTRGIVKIINALEDRDKMNRGDILVSVATTPSLVPTMKKAGAIVTDEGGLTCHASIVSRELEIPCVVGLKFATKIFNDGDMVEVDANKGTVKKI